MIKVQPEMMRVHATYEDVLAYRAEHLNDLSALTDFDAVGEFHKKFGLPVANAPSQALEPVVRDFRIRFMLEELSEYCSAHGIELTYQLTRASDDVGQFTKPDLPAAFDALIDLVYVALGTAHMHRFPWQDGFDAVQKANMLKERAASDGSNSRRGSSFDVVKPAGWTAPDMAAILKDWDESHG